MAPIDFKIKKRSLKYNSKLFYVLVLVFDSLKFLMFNVYSCNCSIVLVFKALCYESMVFYIKKLSSRSTPSVPETSKSPHLKVTLLYCIYFSSVELMACIIEKTVVSTYAQKKPIWFTNHNNKHKFVNRLLLYSEVKRVLKSPLEIESCKV